MSVVVSEKMNIFLSNLETPSSDLQLKAFYSLQELDFPTTQNEYWKYTRLGKISGQQFTTNFVPQPQIDFASYLVSSNYLVIENEAVRLDLSSVHPSIKLNYFTGDSLSEEQVNSAENDVFALLNLAYFKKGIEVKFDKTAGAAPILQLIYVTTGERILSNPRLNLLIDNSVEAKMVITQIDLGGTGCFANFQLNAQIGENAHFTIHKIQHLGDQNLGIITENIVQEKNSTFKINTFTTSGLLVRNNINILVEGENCSTYMNGAIIGKGKQHVDNHTFVNHKVPHCYSNEDYKYVMDEQSTGVFNGRVVVQKNAQVINAYQNNGNILLSDDASIYSKPELEIYADDVKCSHGSTTGQLDEDALFYLQARGISKEKARKMLVSAFLSEQLSAIDQEEISQLIEGILKKDFGWDF
jgi:Fe-S cluster assembly protein SufD